MIRREQVVPLLLEACPSFQSAWDQYEDKDLLYCALGEFARHLLELHRLGRAEALRSAAVAIERLHLEGDDQVREAVTIGLLEGIQNVWLNAGVDAELFKSYLLPTSLKWWNELSAFWKSKRRFVGEGLAKDLSAVEIEKTRADIRTFFQDRGESK